MNCSTAKKKKLKYPNYMFFLTIGIGTQAKHENLLIADNLVQYILVSFIHHTYYNTLLGKLNVSLKTNYFATF